jgi:hypothetical protein
MKSDSHPFVCPDQHLSWPDTVKVIFLTAPSRVESWRSCYELYLQLPLIKPYVRFSRIRLSDYLLPEAFAHACLAFRYGFL